MRIVSRQYWVRGVFLCFIFACLLFWVLSLIYPLKVEIEYSSIVTDKDGTILHAFLTSDDKWRMKTELSEISDELKQAIVYKEDKYFYYHFGVNPIALGRAFFNNAVYRKRTSGASTITMQVARLLAPKKRTYLNKVVEMFRAMQLEWRYSKDEILQLYLNLVPYGSNLEGVKSASVLYFEKSPQHLSLAEVTCLAVIPNRPTSLRLGKNNLRIEKVRNKWLKRFQENEVFPNQNIVDALDEPLTVHRHESPKKAPHFSYRMQQENPHLDIIKTNLDIEAQSVLQQLTKNYVRRLKGFQIENASVMVINNETMAVEAYIGSADFQNAKDGGQVDGIRSVRSPGSTLKPLVYAKGFDRGLLTPKYVLQDVPLNYGGYAPLNFDKTFRGTVTTEDALALSLNVPAVWILNQLTPKTLINTLKQARFQQILKDQNKLGLSVALGGCGVTLEELCGLYASFAHQGKYATPLFLQTDTLEKQQVLFSPEAAFLTTEILTQVQRPDFPSSFAESAGLPRIAWKTGTSYGRRDAWSVGYNEKYTIGVWVGNFSGQGVPELMGARMAAPLLFEIFTYLDKQTNPQWNIPADHLDYRWVCSESGLLPEHFCDNTVLDVYIPMVSTNKKCAHLKYVWVAKDSTVSYCTACMPASGYTKALYPNLSMEMLAYQRDYHIPFTAIPSHNGECERLFTENAPKITSLTNGLKYYVDQDDNVELKLQCQTANDVEQVYWFINDRFYKTAKATASLFFTPTDHEVKVSCADDKGRHEDIFIRVVYF